VLAFTRNGRTWHTAIQLTFYAVTVLLLQDWVNRGAGDGRNTVSLQTCRLATWNTGPKMGGDIKITVRTWHGT